MSVNASGCVTIPFLGTSKLQPLMRRLMTSDACGFADRAALREMCTAWSEWLYAVEQLAPVDDAPRRA
jgi:hypothetical protein